MKEGFEKIRVLFVDDEPRVLDGLRRMLRTLRQEWEMKFAKNGPAALEMLDQESVDAENGIAGRIHP